MKDNFDKLQADFGYTGCVSRVKHEFGQLDFWAKLSAFDEHGFQVRSKWRPIFNYFKHRFKTLYATTCRVLNFMLSKLIGAVSISVMTVSEVRKRIEKFNFDQQSYQNTGKVGVSKIAKFDIDGFFNAIPHDHIFAALTWLLGLWKERFSRRMFVVIPRGKVRSTPKGHTFSRAYGMKLRQTINRNTVNEARTHTSRKCSHHHYVLAVKHLERIIKFDLDTGYLRVGNWLLMQLGIGCAQGSPLSPGLCSMVLRWIEYRSYKIFHSSQRFMNRLILRWVDDIYVVCSKWLFKYQALIGVELGIADVDWTVSSCR